MTNRTFFLTLFGGVFLISGLGFLLFIRFLHSDMSDKEFGCAYTNTIQMCVANIGIGMGGIWSYLMLDRKKEQPQKPDPGSQDAKPDEL